MPFWFPAIAAASAALVLGKALVRHFNGELAQSAVNDPEGVRTVARFAGDARALSAGAARLAERVPGVERVGDTIAAPSPRSGRVVDVVRLCRQQGACTVTLTRAWTGPQLDAAALELLGEIHLALTGAGVTDLAWFARQDRGYANAFSHPFY